MRNYLGYIICSHCYYMEVTKSKSKSISKIFTLRVKKIFYSNLIIPIHFVLWFSLFFFFLKWFGFILFMCPLFGVWFFFSSTCFSRWPSLLLTDILRKEWCLCVFYSLWSLEWKHRGLYLASVLPTLIHSSLWYMVNNNNKKSSLGSWP